MNLNNQYILDCNPDEMPAMTKSKSERYTNNMVYWNIGEYGKVGVFELKGYTKISVLPGATICRDELALRLPEEEDY